MADPLAAGIARHYLTVQALIPVVNQTTHNPIITGPGVGIMALILPAAIIFIAVVTVGTLILFILKARKVAYFMAVFFLALSLSSLPPGLTLMRQPASLVTRADAGHVPRNLIIDQVTPTSFAVSWQTDRATVGAIRVKPAGQPDNLARITSEPDEDVYTHLITVTGLQPAVTYQLTVLSAGAWYQNQNQPLSVTTASP